MNIRQFMKGLMLAIFGTFGLAIVCAVWVSFVCSVGSVSFVIMLVTEGIGGLEWAHKQLGGQSK